MNIITDLAQLRQPSSPLEFLTDKGPDSTEGNEIINKLKSVMEADPTLLALAAPQIGINKRIFCIRFSDTIKTFIDPIITKKANYKIAPETCASMPGKEILISRPEELSLVYYTAEYKYEDNKLLGMAARLFDQQYQLLDGILPDELGLVSEVETDGSLYDLSEDDFLQLVDIYKQYVQVKLDKAREQIKTDDAMAEKFNSMLFSEKVVNGQANVVDKSSLGAEESDPIATAKVALATKSLKNQEKAINQANTKRFLQRKTKR